MKKFQEAIAPYPEFKRFYSIKKRIFPLSSCVDQFPERGKLIDLGCGNGLFAGLLAESRRDLSILGIDDDEKKIQLANRVFGSFQNVSFQKGNIVEIEYPKGDHYSLIDVLYLIPFPLQEAIIDKIAGLIPVQGELIIKEMDKKPLYKYLFNMCQETVSVKILNITLGSRFYFRDAAGMTEMLGKRGFLVETVRMDRGYMHPHILYKARKAIGK